MSDAPNCEDRIAAAARFMTDMNVSPDFIAPCDTSPSPEVLQAQVLQAQNEIDRMKGVFSNMMKSIGTLFDKVGPGYSNGSGQFKGPEQGW